MLKTFRLHLEMIRFSHSVFALPFALLAAVMAWTVPGADGATAPFRWIHFLGLLVCIVAARSAAMAFNRIADRQLDAKNPRTAARHLPTGQISVGAAAAFTAVSSAAFILGTLLFLPNRLPLLLAVPVLLFLLTYSYAKRFTWLAHLWLGMALMLAPVATWIALRGSMVESFPWDLLPAVVLGAAVMFWVAGFDVIYACQDAVFDRETGLRSVPARFGIPLALRLAAISHAVTVALLAALPFCGLWSGAPLPLSWVYGLTVGAIAVLLIIEHRLVRPDDLSRVNVAFFHVNAVISLALFLAGSIDLLWL